MIGGGLFDKVKCVKEVGMTIVRLECKSKIFEFIWEKTVFGKIDCLFYWGHLDFDQSL